MKIFLFSLVIVMALAQASQNDPDTYICNNNPCRCSVGYTQLGTVCIKICPGGTQWDGKQCICPANQVLVNGSCQCSYGYFNSTGGVCTVCTPQSTSPQCSNVVAGNCGGGSYWSGTGCTLFGTPPNSIRCIPNYTFNLQSVGCVSSNNQGTNPTCPSSQYWTGISCIAFTNAANIIYCERGYTWTGQTCQVSSANSQSITCQSGQYWDGIQCQTQFGSSVVCQSGYRWNGYQCA